MYEVDYNYKLTEYGVLNVDASDKEQAEERAKEQIMEMSDDITDIEIENVREI